MRRSLFAILLALVASLTVVVPAVATGPGSWNHVGNGGTAALASLNGQVMVLHKVGTVLYVGGIFQNAGGKPNADRIAKWDGTEWSSLGSAALGTGSVRAIAHYGGKIYAGGNFQDAGGDPDADNLAVFDGTSWAPFCDNPAHAGPTVSLQVNALQVIGTTLYVGGDFQNGAGRPKADYLLTCDLLTGAPGETVDTDGDFTGGVDELVVDTNGVLYAAGGFTNLDQNLLSDHVAAYFGGVWHNLAGGIGTFVRGLAVRGTDLFVGTDQSDVGGIAQADHVAMWDGANWHAMGSNTAGNSGWFDTTTYIYSLTASGSLVFAAGSFQNANGQPAADNIAYFDGTTWRPLGSDGSGNGPWVGEGDALAVVNGLLYAGGNFTSAGGDTKAKFIASRSLRLPDVAINTAIPSGIVGNNIYSATGAGESKNMDIDRGTSQYFAVYVQNDGLVPASFTLKGTGAATGHTVTYIDHDAGVNITAAVRNGTFTTGAIAPGASFLMRMVVKLSATAASTGTFTVQASSTAGTPKDAVKGIVHATH
jgi:hypothetical protein